MASLAFLTSFKSEESLYLFGNPVRAFVNNFCLLLMNSVISCLIPTNSIISPFKSKIGTIVASTK